jgi:hypothetical protein
MIMVAGCLILDNGYWIMDTGFKRYSVDFMTIRRVKGLFFPATSDK